MAKDNGGSIDNEKIYRPPSDTYVMEVCSSIINVWEDFLRIMNRNACRNGKITLLPDGVIKDYYHLNRYGLKSIVYQVEKRKVYYHCFHNGMDITECKAIGLYTFWLNQIKPFFLNEKGSDGNTYFDVDFIETVNSKFAYYFMCTMLANLAEQINMPFKVVDNKSHLYKEFAYSLQFRAISQESLMIMTELIAGVLIEGYSGMHLEKSLN